MSRESENLNLFELMGCEDELLNVEEIKKPDTKNDDFFFFEQDEIIEDLVKEFRTYTCVEDYVKNIMSVPKAKYQFNRLCQGYNDGYNISLLFNPHRLDTSTKTSISMFEAINTSDTYKRAFARYCVKVANRVEVEKDFYRLIGIGSGGIQYVNEFQPYLARDIYKAYCKDGYKVLDPCSGWGGEH